MISRTMQDAINSQIQAEMYSASLYLAMSSYCESINLKGFAHWMRIQAREELDHALKMFDHLIERGGRSLVGAIPQPSNEFKSPRDVFERILEHEKQVTGKINDLYAVAAGEKDYATQTFLHWFISEQVEEEARVTEYVEKLKMIGESSNAIFWIDKELGKRGR